MVTCGRQTAEFISSTNSQGHCPFSRQYPLDVETHPWKIFDAFGCPAICPNVAADSHAKVAVDRKHVWSDFDMNYLLHIIGRRG